MSFILNLIGRAAFLFDIYLNIFLNLLLLFLHLTFIYLVYNNRRFFLHSSRLLHLLLYHTHRYLFVDDLNNRLFDLRWHLCRGLIHSYNRCLRRLISWRWGFGRNRYTMGLWAFGLSTDLTEGDLFGVVVLISNFDHVSLIGDSSSLDGFPAFWAGIVVATLNVIGSIVLLVFLDLVSDSRSSLVFLLLSMELWGLGMIDSIICILVLVARAWNGLKIIDWVRHLLLRPGSHLHVTNIHIVCPTWRLFLFSDMYVLIILVLLTTTRWWWRRWLIRDGILLSTCILMLSQIVVLVLLVRWLTTAWHPKIFTFSWWKWSTTHHYLRTLSTAREFQLRVRRGF